MAGLYDGFEGYRVLSGQELDDALRTSLVSLDANTLLGLYRYSASTTDDLVSVLRSIGDRLVVPHQSLREFWRNRASAIGNPASSVDATRSALEKSLRATKDSLARWAKGIGVDEGLLSDLEADADEAYQQIMDTISSIRPNRVGVGTPADEDPVLRDLHQLLAGKVTDCPDDAQLREDIAEGARRAEAGEPPGFLDVAKSDTRLTEGAAGDYLVWIQSCRAAAARHLNLVIVTGDEKEDWWWRHQSLLLGPRPELAAEFRRVSGGGRLTLLRPRDLLARSSALHVKVSPESVNDAASTKFEIETSMWDTASIDELLDRLDAEGAVQSEIIRAAAQAGGAIDRDSVYEIGGFESDRMLRGFTRPPARITADLQREDTLADNVAPALRAVYGGGVKAAAFSVPAEFVVHLAGG